MGLAHGGAGAGCRACACADLGIAAGRRATTARVRPELGCARACRSARVGWVGRTRAVMGCAASSFASGSRPASASRAGVRAGGGTRASSTASRTARGGAVLERSPGGGRSRAGVGSAGRRVSVAHPNRAVMEPARVECAGAACLALASATFQRLGSTPAGVSGATSDRRTCVERTGGRRVGRPQDRGARSSRRALLVRPGLTARRAYGRRATVELAAPGRPSCSVVAPGSGARARARAELDRLCARRGRRDSG